MKKLEDILENFDYSVDDKILEEYSQDKSIFKIKPKAVVFPKNSEEIKKIVKLAKENNFSLTCRAAGTDMSGGPLTDSVLLVFTKYMNKILEINPQEKYAIVQPGVYFRDLEKELDKYSLMFPSYPASKEICAIGGMVANDSGGEKSLKYGKTHNYVIALKVVLSDGEEYNLESQTLTESPQTYLDNNNKQTDLSWLQTNANNVKMPIDSSDKNSSGQFSSNKDDRLDSIESSQEFANFTQNDIKQTDFYQKTYQFLKSNYDVVQKTKPRVSKNSSGYNIWEAINGNNLDLIKLFVGSQGTLGIITEIKIKLVQKENFSQLIVVFVKDLKNLPSFTQDILNLQPTSLEITDDHTFKIFLRFAKEMASLLGAKGIFSMLKLFFPEILLFLKIGFPKLIILAEFTGNDKKEITNKINQSKEILKKFKYVYHEPKDALETEKYWRLRRDTYKLLREKIKNLTAAPFIDDFIILPQYLPEFLPRLYKILDEYRLVYTISGHLGDGNFHIIPLVNLKNNEQRKNILEITDKVYDLVLQYNGILTAEHNDGLIRGPYLAKEYGEQIFNIFKEIKNIFDPLNIFNPYKKVMAIKDYIEKFMIN
ncbi:MAG: hypothetical protein KatS3mg095_0449 [Candidatus Parcubacteria bacterium]|nr:MAG: hypothetical protein KatS3mg095_0449 [Candidatus Parcubacteria bacterium]